MKSSPPTSEGNDTPQQGHSLGHRNTTHYFKIERVEFLSMLVGRRFIRVVKDWYDDSELRRLEEIREAYDFYQEYQKISESEVVYVDCGEIRTGSEGPIIRQVGLDPHRDRGEIPMYNVECLCKKNVVPDDVLMDCVDE